MDPSYKAIYDAEKKRREVQMPKKWDRRISQVLRGDGFDAKGK